MEQVFSKDIKGRKIGRVWMRPSGIRDPLAFLISHLDIFYSNIEAASL